MARRGRSPGRELTPDELRYLSLLFADRERAQRELSRYDELLEDFVLELRDGGCSARGIANQLGVGASTVQTWTTNARRRREASG